jgi:hypothetical protein
VPGQIIEIGVVLRLHAVFPGGEADCTTAVSHRPVRGSIWGSAEWPTGNGLAGSQSMEVAHAREVLGRPVLGPARTSVGSHPWLLTLE